MSSTMNDCVLATQAFKLFPIKSTKTQFRCTRKNQGKTSRHSRRKLKEVPTGVVSLVFPRSALLLMYLYATYKRMKAGCKNKIKNYSSQNKCQKCMNIHLVSTEAACLQYSVVDAMYIGMLRK